MYLSTGEVTLFEALTAHCSSLAVRPWDELGEDELQRIARPVRDALIAGRVTVRCISASGLHRAVEAARFRDFLIWEAAFDPTPASIEFEDGPWSGHLVVDRNEFDHAIHDEPRSPAPLPAYIPPILAYAIELSERFELSPDYKFMKKDLARKIERMAAEEAPDLRISPDKAKYISMFLGNPQHEGRGPPRSEPGQRPVDPSKAFNGKTYPTKRRPT